MTSDRKKLFYLREYARVGQYRRSIHPMRDRACDAAIALALRGTRSGGEDSMPLGRGEAEGRATEVSLRTTSEKTVCPS